MADQALEDLTAADTPLTTDELVYITQGGNSRKATVNEIFSGGFTMSDGDAKIVAGHTASIGVSGDHMRFQAHGIDTEDAGIAAVRWTTGGPDWSLGRCNSGVIGDHTGGTVGDAQRLASIQYFGSDGTEFIRAGRMQVFAKGTVATGIVPGEFQFEVMNEAGSDVTVFQFDWDNIVSFGRNGGNDGKYYFYRAFTDVDNYERLAIQSTAGLFEIAVETAGTGTDDIDLVLSPAGGGTVRPLTDDGTVTLGSTTVGWGGLDLTSGAVVRWGNAANIAYDDGSGTLIVTAGNDNGIIVQNSNDTGPEIQVRYQGDPGNSRVSFGIDGDGFPHLGFGGGTDPRDVFFYRDTAAVMAVRNSTNAQTLRVYRTFTDSSNYERLALFTSAGNVELAAETAGTGTDAIGIKLTSAGGANVRLTSNVTDFYASNGLLQYYENSAAKFKVIGAGTTNVSLASDMPIGWNSGANLDSGSLDTGLHRAAAGIVEVNSGTAGTLRDIRARRYYAPMTSELTIATGAITVTGSYHNVDTEADAASDDLDTISGGTDGAILVLRANNDARTVVVKDSTGNLELTGDMSLDNTQDTITLIFDNALSAWLEISRSDNTA
jgi:hypothetical protein